MKTASTGVTFLNVGNPTGLKFTVDHGASRALFEIGLEHAPGAMPFGLGVQPRPERELRDLMAVGMAPRRTGVLGRWDGRTNLFVTHMHLDHCALVRCVHPGVPLYYPAAMEPLREACARAGYVPWRTPPGTAVADRSRVLVGDIEVEFVAVDHDLPGATGFLIRTPDVSVAYTGDHRWHGVQPELTARFADAARGTDVLIIETVALGLEPPPEGGPAPWERTEADVIDGFGEVLDRAPGLVVVNLYPMNRVRVHAFGVACEARGRTFLMEPQSAVVAGWPLTLEDSAAIRRHPERYCVQLGFEGLPTLIDLHPRPGSIYVHSNGIPLGPYDPCFQVMMAWIRTMGLELVTLGSSGHSLASDIGRTVGAVAAGTVLPVHSRRPGALRLPGVSMLLPEVGRRYTAAELRGC